MLLQRTPGPDSHDLHSPADTECRKTNSIGSIQQTKLPGISITAHFGHGMGHLAVALRVDIGTTANDQSVEARDDLNHAVVLGRQQYDHTARSLDRAGVDSGQQVGRHIPDTPSSLLTIGGQTDDRPPLFPPHRDHAPYSHILSKPRFSSQSVTAASNAANSRSAIAV